MNFHEIKKKNQKWKQWRRCVKCHRWRDFSSFYQTSELKQLFSKVYNILKTAGFAFTWSSHFYSFVSPRLALSEGEGFYERQGTKIRHIRTPITEGTFFRTERAFAGCIKERCCGWLKLSQSTFCSNQCLVWHKNALFLKQKNLKPWPFRVLSLVLWAQPNETNAIQAGVKSGWKRSPKTGSLQTWNRFLELKDADFTTYRCVDSLNPPPPPTKTCLTRLNLSRV